MLWHLVLVCYCWHNLQSYALAFSISFFTAGITHGVTVLDLFH